MGKGARKDPFPRASRWFPAPFRSRQQLPVWVTTCPNGCHRSRLVYLHEAAWFNGAVASPSPRLWAHDRRHSRLNFEPAKTTSWIWNGACRWAKFSASEKHRNHGQSSAVSARSRLRVCVCACACMNDGAALTETATNRCGCSLTGAPAADARHRQRSCPQRAAGSAAMMSCCYLLTCLWQVYRGVCVCVGGCARHCWMRVGVFVLDVWSYVFGATVKPEVIAFYTQNGGINTDRCSDVFHFIWSSFPTL